MEILLTFNDGEEVSYSHIKYELAGAYKNKIDYPESFKNDKEVLDWIDSFNNQPDVGRFDEIVLAKELVVERKVRNIR